MSFVEIEEKFCSHEEWIKFSSENKFIFDGSYIKFAISEIKKRGIIDINNNVVLNPESIIIKGENYRETIKHGLLNCRNRALIYALKKFGSYGRSDLLARSCKIYAPEALTDFALHMRAKYPLFIGSEYASNQQQREKIFPILSEDLTDLSFESSVFDLVITNDVLEHVPDIDKSLCEIFRILNSAGLLLTNVPFAFNKKESVVRSVMKNGNIFHLLPPQYHGNPMDPAGGSLVYEIPGWDLVSRAKSAGFHDSYFLFISSIKYGIIGKGLAGVFIFFAVK